MNGVAPPFSSAPIHAEAVPSPEERPRHRPARHASERQATLLSGAPLFTGDDPAKALVIDDAAPFSDRLFGDWGGMRSTLADRGLTVNLDGTYSLQSVADGGSRFGHDEGNVFSGQLGFVLDTGKAGLWPGGFLSEGRDGDSVLHRAGSTSPVNNDALLPSRNEDRWGLGLFHQSFADDGLLAAAGIEEETGAEFFYNIALGRGTSLTFDIQVVDSAIPQIDTVLVLGARLGIRF